MPEAAIHKNCGAVLREHNVRTSWKVPPVETEAIAPGVQAAPDKQFRLGVLTPDAGHHFAAFGLGDDVSHAFPPEAACQLR